MNTELKRTSDIVSTCALHVMAFQSLEAPMSAEPWKMVKAFALICLRTAKCLQTIIRLHTLFLDALGIKENKVINLEYFVIFLSATLWDIVSSILGLQSDATNFIGGSKGGGAPGTHAPGSKFFHFYAVFGKKLKNNSTFGSWRTPRENPGSATELIEE